ncbi:MAG TPA: DUF1800 domain-containing protein [Thermoanaerobaculia bacterium]|nr:DUF1800 domain-containing protein [Thermoanaerobaculia bacterium]
MASIVWDRRAAAHLYRRAGFGATPEETDRAVDEGMEASVARLVDYESIDDSALEQRLARARIDPTTFVGILRWWLLRMMYTARPLEERMTFLLHDHFATSAFKVQDPGWMLQQNELLRRYALGDLTELTIEISRDPAMLVWLDNYLSRKEHPNENYGRELLELFLLGHGAYSEQDVMSATRAFTGWTISRRTRQFTFIDAIHDHGQKTFLGQTGDWNGDDVVRIACESDAHAHFMAHKMFESLAYANPDEHVIHQLAHVYHDSGTSMRELVRAILTSDAFYSDAAIWAKVKSPVDHAIASVRQLRIDGDPSRFAASILAYQGQVPFNPPDVDGWPSGLAWINSGTLLGRMNYATAVTAASDPFVIGAGATIGNAAEMVSVFLDRLGPIDVPHETRARLEGWVSPDGGLPGAGEYAATGRGLAHLILSLAEWQLN